MNDTRTFGTTIKYYITFENLHTLKFSRGSISRACRQIMSKLQQSNTLRERNIQHLYPPHFFIYLASACSFSAWHLCCFYKQSSLSLSFSNCCKDRKQAHHITTRTFNRHHVCKITMIHTRYMYIQIHKSHKNILFQHYMKWQRVLTNYK